MSRRPSRITHKASPKRSKRYGLMPDFRPTISIRSRISGGTSKKLFYPTAGRSRRAVQKKTMSTSWHGPSSYGKCVGSSSRNPPIYLWRKSRPLQSWKERMRVLSTASAVLSGSWRISSTIRKAKLKLKQLRQEINAVDDDHLQKILTFFDDHWEQALRYLRKKGMGKHRRGSNSESGMRLLRRLEKNHDGIRSAATR